MSRLEAKAKLLYYRTPEVIVEAVARYLTLPTFATVRLLDPCAGTGAALSLLVQRLKEQFEASQSTCARRGGLILQTYGIEPELLRAREASRCLDYLLQTSFFSTTLSHGDSSDGGWQCIFVNPPYDTDTENAEKGRKTRLEINFLRRATDKLCPEGILIWIVPQPILKQAAKFLTSHYQKMACLRFPDDLWQPDGEKPEQVSLYEQFHQVVLFAQKRCYSVPTTTELVEQVQRWASAGADLRSLSLDVRLPDMPTYEIPAALLSEIRHFSAGFYDPDVTARLVTQSTGKAQRYQTGVWANADYLKARFPDPAGVGLRIGQPVAPLKNAHLAVLSVAGIANQAVLESADGRRRVIVKGSSRKVPVYSCSEDEEEIVEKVTDTFETALWCIDLETGGLIRVETSKKNSMPFSVEYESMSLPSFLDHFGISLTQRVAQANPARYKGEDQLPWIEAGLKLLKRQPLGKQREIILAHVQGFVKEKRLTHVAPVAEMAAGKTFLSLCSAFLSDLYACGGTMHMMPATRLTHIFPLVVLAPSIMARKWKREAEQTLPNVKAVIIKRMGTLSLKKKAALEDDEEDDERGNRANDLAEFRQFDPDFSDSSLSAIGCMDRVVARIGKELTAWQREYRQAIAYNQAIQKGDIAGELRTLPLKPCHIVIITGSTAKLGKEWMPVYRLKVARYMDPRTKQVKLRRNAEGEIYTVPCCPGCGRAIKDERRAAQLEKMSPEYRELLAQVEAQRNKRRMEAFEEESLEPPMLYLTEQDLIGTRDRRVKRSCSECGEALWQYVAVKPTHWRPYSVLDLKKEAIPPLPLPERGHPLPCITNTFRRRYPLGDYLLKHYKHVFHMLIADEVHEGSDGTALDFARQRLASACGRMMGLTGTLSNGYSASLFRLYYLLNPSIRRDFGYQDVERWIDAYGKRQTTIKTYKEQEIGYGSSSDRRIGKPVTREMPGFAPQGLARVLPCSTFLELCDVVPGLPPYREEVHQVDLGPVLGPAYEAFEQETTRAIGKMLACGDKSGLSSWWNGLLTYPNMPYQGWTCTVKKSGEVLGHAPALPENQLYPKEQALVKIVQREHNSGRRVLIYTENTGTLDILPRLKKILETRISGRMNQPINVAILRSTTVDPINREAWLDKQVEAGCDVLICNPKLVRVGLDLRAPRCAITA